MNRESTLETHRTHNASKIPLRKTAGKKNGCLETSGVQRIDLEDNQRE
jgi:hypothetical protein